MIQVPEDTDGVGWLYKGLPGDSGTTPWGITPLVEEIACEDPTQS